MRTALASSTLNANICIGEGGVRVVRAGFLRLVLSVLVAITLVAGRASACVGHGNNHSSGVTVAATAMASGMESCHHVPAKTPGHSAESPGCPHCIALGLGVLVPAPVVVEIKPATAATPAARPAVFSAGLLTAPDTGPPRSVRT